MPAATNGTRYILASLVNPTTGESYVATATDPLPAGIDRSGSINAGGTAQQLAAANPARLSLTFVNTSDAVMTINETGGNAGASGTAGSWPVPAGSTFSVSTNRAISVWGATTGKTFTATET